MATSRQISDTSSSSDSSSSYDDIFDPARLQMILEGNMVDDVDMNYFPGGLVVATNLLFSINVILCIICAGWTIRNRAEWIVKVGHPRILLSVIVGCFISNLALPFASAQTGFPYILDDTTGEIIENPDIGKVHAFCRAWPFVFFMGTGITISVLIAKLRHVHKIHRQAKSQGGKHTTTQITEISRKDASWVVGSILLVKLVLNTAWLIYDPSYYLRTFPIPNEDDDIPMESYGFCESETFYDFAYANLTLDILLSVYVITLCWKTKGFDDPYEESKYIFFAVLFQFEFMVVALPLWEFVELDLTTVQYLLLFAYIFLYVFVPLALLFIPKMIKLYNFKRGKDIRKKKTIPLSALTNSKWDSAVDNINRLLDKDRDPYQAMTDKQRNALQSAKRILLKGPNGQTRRKFQFIPKNLLNESMIEERISPAGTVRISAKKGVHVSNNTRFLMSVYGGINLNTFKWDESLTEDDEDDDENGINGSNNDIENNKSNRSSYKVQEEETESDLYHIPKEFHALSNEDKLSLCKLLSWKELNSWDYNIFELNKVSGGHPLLFMGYAILGSPYSLYAMSKDCGALGSDITSVDDVEGYHFVDNANLRIPMRNLCNYLRVIEEDYTSDNPYHNEIHGADVVQTLHVLIQMKGDIFPTSNEELFSILLSAVVHDVNHPGENNAFQMNSETELALVYNDISVLENRHASHAFKKMLSGRDTTTTTATTKGSKQQEDNILCNVKEGKLADIRKRVISAVLHTDMSKHFQSVGELKTLVSSGIENHSDGTWQVLQYMLHLADISNPAKPKPISLLWTDRCLEEFFAQGDKESKIGLEVSPNCDRKSTKKPDSQIGFINFVIKPAYEVLADIIPSVRDEILIPHIEANLQYWKSEKENATKQEKEMETTQEQATV